MRVIVPGHQYELDLLDVEKHACYTPVYLQFVQRKVDADPNRHERPGTINQEVLRVLIDRMKFLDAEKPWYGNEAILRNCRNAITLHEIRAYEMKLRKAGYTQPEIFEDDALDFVVHTWLSTYYKGTPLENIPVGEDGHWVISLKEADRHLLDSPNAL